MLQEFLNHENISVNQKRIEGKILDKFISYLEYKNYKYSKQELADMFKISRATIYRKIKKVRINDRKL